ncbi:ABC transporter permease [Bremerella sp. JC770]|uniref:ABC transporter permease n=1 Tax=Bremerella sp. JC770 TaxID=3232137 RepID=UPI0034585FD4
MSSKSIQGMLVQYGGLCLVLVIMVGVFSLLSENFLQRATFTSIANQIPDLTLVAVGMTFILVVGGIDLSVGSILALSSAVLGALMVDAGWPLWAAIPVCLLTGALCGLFNGSVSIGFRIPSFIVTLGMLEIARGATKVVTDSQTKYIGSKVEVMGDPLPYLQLSPAFLLALAAVLVGQFLLSRTVFGRYCIAIGTNEEAVRMSGIRTAPYSIAVFTLSGLLCGLAGIAQTSRLSSADPNAAIGLELSAIAACVIGGTSLMGGRGSVVSSFIGVLIISVLQTGLAQVGVSDANKQIITGSVIVVAVLADALRNRFGK